MTKGTDSIFSLFDVRHFNMRGTFWHTAVHTMHPSCAYQCPPLCSFIFAGSEKC